MTVELNAFPKYHNNYYAEFLRLIAELKIIMTGETIAIH